MTHYKITYWQDNGKLATFAATGEWIEDALRTFRQSHKTEIVYKVTREE